MLTETDNARIAGRVAAAYRPVSRRSLWLLREAPLPAAATSTFRDQETGTAFPADIFAVRRLLFDVLHPIDVQVFDPAEFEESAYEYQSFTWVIARRASTIGMLRLSELSRRW